MATTTTSKQFWLNTRDLLQALIMTMIGAVVPIIAQSMTAKAWIFDWTTIWHTAAAAGFAYLVKKFFTPSQTITTPARILLVIVCMGLATAGQAQILKPLEKPKAPVEAKASRFVRAYILADSTMPQPSKDSTFKGWRLTGLSVLYGITDGYTVSNVYAGTGFGFEHDTYRQSTGRWSTDWAIGIGGYAGGHVSPNNLQAVTAIGLNVALFNKFLLLGVLYNLNSPAGQKGKWVGAIGGNAAFIPTN